MRKPSWLCLNVLSKGVLCLIMCSLSHSIMYKTGKSPLSGWVCVWAEKFSFEAAAEGWPSTVSTQLPCMQSLMLMLCGNREIEVKLTVNNNIGSWFCKWYGKHPKATAKTRNAPKCMTGLEVPVQGQQPPLFHLEKSRNGQTQAFRRKFNSGVLNFNAAQLKSGATKAFCWMTLRGRGQGRTAPHEKGTMH